ncbi:unnamed protein product [Adineta ricciae]|uniref:Uncharacterized protein n=1 Tax=Adineta ricciae TaxID=249248 RepID=A0A813ZE98_ADIRI|nr:unnamed protein product [Adineta ricciae]
MTRIICNNTNNSCSGSPLAAASCACSRAKNLSVYFNLQYSNFKQGSIVTKMYYHLGNIVCISRTRRIERHTRQVLREYINTPTIYNQHIQISKLEKFLENNSTC